MKEQFRISIPNQKPITINLNDNEKISILIENPPSRRWKNEALKRPNYKISGVKWTEDRQYELEWEQQFLSLNDKLTLQFIEGSEYAISVPKETLMVQPEKACSFCDKKKSEVNILIDAGTSSLICDRCVKVCQMVIDDHQPSIDSDEIQRDTEITS